jgi:predicted oxidoreductase
MNKELSQNKIILGLMRTRDLSTDEEYKLIKGALDLGIHFFDISDIYSRGVAESNLGNVLKEHPELRKEMIIQSKCGIVKENNDTVVYYDLSYKHIKEACYASLKRMNLDYLDYYLLHRPDILLDAKEVAKAFKELYEEGKVKHFGVSNFPKEMIEYLKTETKLPIEVDQLQIGLGHLNMLDEVIDFNMDNNESISRTSEIFYYLKRNKMALQIWSPYQVGLFKGIIFNDPNYGKTNDLLNEIGAKYSVSACAIATAFLFSLGDNIEVLVGSTNLEHIKQSLDGLKVKLTKAEWYSLYLSTGHVLP